VGLMLLALPAESSSRFGYVHHFEIDDLRYINILCIIKYD
jgi:hypothetical protein